MSSGGARTGAGRKRKSDAERALEGKGGAKRAVNPKPVKPKAVELDADDCPEPHEYMTMATKNASENIAPRIYREIFAWLRRRGCDHLVQPQLVEQYALSFARYTQAETAIHQFGFLAKHATSGQPIPSPFLEISDAALKKVQSTWLTLYSIVRDNCSSYADGQEDDVMEQILSGKWAPKDE
jgi:phage terminase small subunit